MWCVAGATSQTADALAIRARAEILYHQYD